MKAETDIRSRNLLDESDPPPFATLNGHIDHALLRGCEHAGQNEWGDIPGDVVARYPKEI